jgi:prepilin-type N-terminal cleavage/methylation domain-containing protein
VSGVRFVIRHSSFVISRAFTLIEIMVVVGIMALVMATSVPFVYHALHREPLNQAVRDVEEVCNNARARAIMQGAMTEIVFHPKEKRFEIAGATGKPPEANAVSRPDLSAVPPTGSGLAAQLGDKILIEMLDVNLFEYKDVETARVRFYPNGTCDELTLILHSMDADGHDHDKWRKISLEVTTGMASVESDPSRFK